MKDFPHWQMVFTLFILYFTFCQTIIIPVSVCYNVFSEKIQ
nr:MAG TPA_asm: hypothetical protein [Caudoviricetes sp.]